MKKNYIIVLFLSHLLCILFGCCIFMTLFMPADAEIHKETTKEGEMAEKNETDELLSTTLGDETEEIPIATAEAEIGEVTTTIEITKPMKETTQKEENEFPADTQILPSESSNEQQMVTQPEPEEDEWESPDL